MVGTLGWAETACNSGLSWHDGLGLWVELGMWARLGWWAGLEAGTVCWDLRAAGLLAWLVNRDGGLGWAGMVGGAGVVS